MMIFDVINFLDELEMLEIRFNELDELVDKFVIVESDKTFQNNSKELVFEANKKLFDKWTDKIIHVVVADSPDTDDPWQIEEFQLNAGYRGFANLQDNDIILWCNADEIPNRKTVEKYIENDGRTAMMMQYPIGGYLNCWFDTNPTWTGGRLIKGLDWKTSSNCYKDFRKDWLEKQIQDCGWHFCNCGGLARTRRKIESYAHKELNHEPFKSSLEYKLWCCYNFYDPKTGKTSTRLPFDLLPKYISDNREKFSHMLIPEKTEETKAPDAKFDSPIFAL